MLLRVSVVRLLFICACAIIMSLVHGKDYIIFKSHLLMLVSKRMQIELNRLTMCMSPSQNEY